MSLVHYRPDRRHGPEPPQIAMDTSDWLSFRGRRLIEEVNTLYVIPQLALKYRVNSL